jgi:hypothetical protein
MLLIHEMPILADLLTHHIHGAQRACGYVLVGNGFALSFDLRDIQHALMSCLSRAKLLPKVISTVRFYRIEYAGSISTQVASKV